MKRRQNKQNYSDFLIKNPEYHLKYIELLKEARVWNSTGQYWLGNESSRRAKCLEKGDVAGYLSFKHSDILFYNKDKDLC